MNFNDDRKGLINEEQKILNDFIGNLESSRDEVCKSNKNNTKKEWNYARNNLYNSRLVVEASLDTNKTHPITKEIKIGLHGYSNPNGEKIIFAWTDEWVRDYSTNRKLREWSFTRNEPYKCVTNFKLLFEDKIDIDFDKVKDVDNLVPIVYNKKTLEKLRDAKVLSSEYIQQKLLELEGCDDDVLEEIICDPFLKELVERRNDVKFKNIVFTIQEKQGEIIRLPFNDNIIVQGCAGSGKSMILFHRLPFLLTDPSRKTDESEIYIVTPSEKYIELSDTMRDDLEIINIKIGTMQSYYKFCIERYGVDIDKLLVNSKDSISITNENEKYIYSTQCVKDIVDFLYEETNYSNIPTDNFCKTLDIKGKNNTSLKENSSFNTIVKSRISFINKLIFSNNNALKTYYNQLIEIYDTIQNLMGESSKYEPVNDINEIYQQIDFIRNEIITFFKQYQFDEEYIQTKKSIFSLVTNLFKTNKAETTSDKDKKVIECKEKFEKLESKSTKFLSVDDYETLSNHYDYIRNFDKYFIVYVYDHIVKNISLPSLTKKIAALPFTYYLCLQIVYNYCGVGKYKKEELIAIDEAQNFAVEEIKLLKSVNDNKVVLNLYGDEKQHVENTKGINSWSELNGICNFDIKYLYENYRNSYQVANYCNNRFGMQMKIINTSGNGVSDITDFSTFKDTIVEKLSSDSKIGLGAIIVENQYEKEWLLDQFSDYSSKLFDTFKDKDIHSTKWNIVSIADAKGLEFKSVIAISGAMTENEKYIAYTRALDELTIYDGPIDISEYKKKQNETQKKKLASIESTKSQINKESFESKKKETNLNDSNVKKFFESKGVKVVDKRASGGKLWVVGKKSRIEKYVQEAIETFHISGKYASNGDLHITSGWCTKTKK